MIKTILQKLLKNNNSDLFELYDSFVMNFPNESGTQSLLRDYIFSENPMDSIELQKALKELEGKV